MPDRAWEVWDAARVCRYMANFGTVAAPRADHARRMQFAASLCYGNRLLDVGCGLGHLYPYLPPQLAKGYLGVDTSGAMLAKARELNPAATFEHGDIYDLDAFGVYDTVCCQSVLVHLPDIRGPLKQLWAHSRRVLVISLPLADAASREQLPYKEGRYLICRIFSRADFENLVAGLTGVAQVAAWPVRTAKRGGGLHNHYVRLARCTSA